MKGIPKKMKTSGSGNAAWRAAMAKTQIKRGAVNRRICNAIARHSGKPCGKLALRGVTQCQWHAGRLQQWNLEKAKHGKKTARTDNAKRKADRQSRKEQSPRGSQGIAFVCAEIG
jgi:hypothetical protein